MEWADGLAMHFIISVLCQTCVVVDTPLHTYTVWGTFCESTEPRPLVAVNWTKPEHSAYKLQSHPNCTQTQKERFVSWSHDGQCWSSNWSALVNHWLAPSWLFAVILAPNTYILTLMYVVCLDGVLPTSAERWGEIQSTCWVHCQRSSCRLLLMRSSE